MPKTKTYIFTRINLGLHRYSETGPDGKNPWKDINEWMQQRYDLFLETAYPSVMQQTDMDFDYCLLLDRKTSGQWVHKYHGVKGVRIFLLDTERYDIHPVGRHRMHHMGVVSKLLNDDSELVITSRLDSDDCIHKDYVRAVKENLPEEPGHSLHFANGYYNMRSEPKGVYEIEFHNNMFPAVIESRGDMKTVFAQEHTVLERSFNSSVIKTDPMWMWNWWPKKLNLSSQTSTYQRRRGFPPLDSATKVEAYSGIECDFGYNENAIQEKLI